MIPLTSGRLWRAAVVIATLAVLAGPAAAQELSITLADDGSLATRTIQLIVLLTVLSIAPGIAIMVTCFPFIVTVLAILRQAIGLQQSPPSMLMVTLAMFLTYFVMEPVFMDAWAKGIEPVLSGSMAIDDGFSQAMVPLRGFMQTRIEPETLSQLAALRPDLDPVAPATSMPLSVVVPSFLLSEMEHAFKVGFLIFLPFLIIDLVVAAVLMSMGMMMVPPAIVSLPFKLAFFVVADGWSLIAASLVRGYAT